MRKKPLTIMTTLELNKQIKTQVRRIHNDSFSLQLLLNYAKRLSVNGNTNNITSMEQDNGAFKIVQRFGRSGGKSYRKQGNCQARMFLVKIAQKNIIQLHPQPTI